MSSLHRLHVEMVSSSYLVVSKYLYYSPVLTKVDQAEEEKKMLG